MAGAAKKWFIGCGIGCGLFVLIMAGVGALSYKGIRKAMDQGDNIESGFEELRATYGGPAEFVPEPEGFIPTNRMMAFLSVREALTVQRKEAGDLLRTIDDQEVDGAKPNFIQKAKAGIQLIPGMMGFLDQRNQALLSEGMGLGEYLYIYSLSYYNLLEKDPADGPSVQVTGDDEGEDDHGYRWNVSAGKGGEEELRRNRAKVTRRGLHRVQLQIARNQLAALLQRSHIVGFREQLEQEIATMEDEPLRLLWETGLPVALHDSLEPYAGQLEESYDPMTNVLESGLVEHE